MRIIIVGSTCAAVLAIFGVALIWMTTLGPQIAASEASRTSKDGATTIIYGTSDIYYPSDHPVLGAALCAGALAVGLLTARQARASRVREAS
jgi:hypothetical protein